jgi:toxin ParE1/3/4
VPEGRAAERPLLRRSRDDILPGLRGVLVHPYILFYRLTAGGIEVVRVVHGHRDLAAIFRKRKDKT